MQLDEVVKIEDLSDSESCDPFLIKLEQVAILIGVRQRLLHDEASAYTRAAIVVVYDMLVCTHLIVRSMVLPALL